MENNGHNSPDRLDRIEKIVEVMANIQADIQLEHKALLRAQVLLTEAQANTEKRLNTFMSKTDERLAEATDKLNALITLMDQHVREHDKGLQ